MTGHGNSIPSVILGQLRPDGFIHRELRLLSLLGAQFLLLVLTGVLSMVSGSGTSRENALCLRH